MSVLDSTLARVGDAFSLLPPLTPLVFLSSVASLVTFYALCVKYFKIAPDDEKRKGWLLTAASSFVLTAASIPFVVDLLKASGDLKGIQRRPFLADTVSTFFVAYLILDLSIGWKLYRSQVSWLTGYVHHVAYTLLVTYLIGRGFSHVFCLCAFMELPTFVLAISFLFPSTRNDIAFSILFFHTRIGYHAVLIGLFVTPYGRTYGTSPLGTTPTVVPVVALFAAAPLHVMWFTTSTLGLLRRRRLAKLKSNKPATPPSPFLLPIRQFASSRVRRFRQKGAALNRDATGLAVRDYFLQLPPPLSLASRLGAAREESDDVVKVLNRPLTRFTLRLNPRLEDISRLSNRVRRRIGATVGGGAGLGFERGPPPVAVM